MLQTLLLATAMVAIPQGEVQPLYLQKDGKKWQVEAFKLDATPVTNAQFYQFVKAQPTWQKAKAPSVFVEPNYLKHWPSNAPAKADANKPVVYVSWFAANAYCKAQGKMLPSVAQWEYVGSASQTKANGSEQPAFRNKILQWYARPGTTELANVGQSPANFYGIQDMHGLVWEWTNDFNQSLVTGASRADSSLDKGLYCGSAAAGSADPSDYAAFMRFGFRSSLQAKFTLRNLGFRCAQNAAK
jgi:formylglycine-generating enzyme required for sulfatase activity